MEQNEKNAPVATETAMEVSPPYLIKTGRGNTRNRRYACKNLKFLTDLFDALNITPEAYSKLTPNPISTSRGLRIQLNNDDMKISKARAIVDTLGYELEIKLTEKTKKQEDNDDYIVNLPEDIRKIRKTKKYDNLNFLYQFMQENKLTMRSLANKIGMSSGTIFTWFRTDDMSVSYLNIIRKALDVNLEFNIKKKEAVQEK